MTRVLPAVDDRDLNVLIRGAQAAFANAQELFFEAAILGKAGHLSRALFLHQISMEECGKVDLLSGWIAGELLGFQQDTKKLERALASHEAKNIANAYMLELSEEEKLARQRKDWKGERNVFTRVKREFHEKSNRAKNAALYVDIKDGNVTTPQGSITTNMVAEIALQNERYLGLMQQSVRSMSKWRQDPTGTKEALNQLHERIEQLRKEMPDDPYRAMQVIVHEIAAQAKKVAKSGKKS